MNTHLTPPPALQGDAQAQMRQMYRYLFRISEQLNMALSSMEQDAAALQTSIGGAVRQEKLTADMDQQYRNLKSLIIKTAHTVRAEMDRIVTGLDSKYLAISDWGTYREEIHREIVDTAEKTVESYNYGASISELKDQAADFEAYRVEASGYITRGIIGYDDENFPIIGIAIGQDLKTKTVVIDGVEYPEIDTTRNLATYTAERITFWINGVPMAHLSNGELVVTRAIITDSIQLGDWDIAVNAQDGLTVQKRIGNDLDLSGNNSILITADKVQAVVKDLDLSANDTINVSAAKVQAVIDRVDLRANEAFEIAAGTADAAQSAAGEAREMADAAQSAANDAQEMAEAATIANSPEPPAPPLEKGRKWIDTGVNPWVLRSWMGADVSNAREFGVGANDVNPALLDAGRVNSWTAMEIRPELVQLGAGAPSKANLRRIPRIQEVVLSNPGKNLFNPDLFRGVSVIRGTVELIENGLTVRASGDNCYTGGWNRSDSEHLSRRICVSPGERISMSWNHSGADGRVSLFFDGVPESEVASNSGKIEVAVPEGISFITVRFGVTSAGGSASYQNIQIEVSEHPTPYEPFNGNAVRIPMPSGFYGGIVNPMEGMIRSDIQVVNLNGTETWVTANTQGGSKQRMRLLGLSDYVHPDTNSIAVDGACSHYPTVKADDTFLEKTGFSSQDGYAPEGILFFDPDYQSVEAWKAFLAQQNAVGTPVQIAVRRTSPQYYNQSIDPPKPVSGRNRLSATLGKLGVSAMASGWETVSDTSEMEAALGAAQLDIEQAREAASQATENLERRVRLDANGLHVGDSQTNNELLMQSALIHFVINGQRVSTIASDYHRFGNMEIRTPSSAGGIVIQAVQ